MAGYVTINAYDATLRVPEFKGIQQYGDGVGLDPRYAMESVNVLTTDGVLRPMSACEMLPPELPHPIETLARLHRRYYVADEEKDVLIAAAGGLLYWCIPTGERWNPIPMPAGMVDATYKSSRWSCVTYEINPEGSVAPVDVLLMSNAQDGMICVRGDNLTVELVPTPKKFGVIERYAERIWGADIPDDPDMLVYSAPYDPFDWEANVDIPEDGAGDILQPSWDGDSFTMLKTFGSQLMAFKRTRVWRVLGTNPGEYTFKEQFGGGTQYERTVAVDVARILMMGRDGLLQYDGESVYPYYQETAQGIYKRMNVSVLEHAFGVLWKNRYYCAIPLDGSPINNAVLVYDIDDRTFLLRTDVCVETFLPTDDAMYFTSATTPGRLWKFHDDCMETGNALPMRWQSGWQDLSYKNMTKGSFTVYLTVDCKEDVELKLSIQTEKKTKTKTLTFSPPGNGREAKQRRVVFGGNGRRFRYSIESDGNKPWRIIGGLQIEAETDTD